MSADSNSNTHKPLILPMATGTPEIGSGCYIAPTANIIGQVKIGQKCSIWFNAIVRGDVMPIEIGDETNIQDGTVIHGTYKKCGTKIGRRVSVGHSVILHGCEIADRVLIGMGTIIMDQAKISSDSLVGAGSLVTQGAEFPPGVLIMGRPAKVVRNLTPEEIQNVNRSADNYLFYMKWYESN